MLCYVMLCYVMLCYVMLIMAVSAAILEIFSVKEWPDIEIWVAVLQGN